MGLLDRWTKKNEAQRLEKNAEPKSEVKLATVKDEKKPATKSKKIVATKKTNNKNVVEKESTETAAAENTAPKAKKIDSKILLRALVTEKSAIKQSENKYIFVVALDANKAIVKKAVEEVYNVRPLHVNIINMQGKAMRFGKNSGKRGDFKKAIVTLPKGKTIVIHEGV